jgi:hypothetical protein
MVPKEKSQARHFNEKKISVDDIWESWGNKRGKMSKKKGERGKIKGK